jgi:hypothetical protein
MLRHDNSSVLVFDSSIAQNKNFFNGAYNTLALDFDPLVSGYAFFRWTVLPSWITKAYPGFKAMTEKNFLEGFSISDIELETTTITQSFAANEYNVATNSKKGNTDFSIKHREFSGSPIRNMYQHWITGIRDPETGIATYPKIYGIDYAAKNHTGEIIYIVTRPDANNVDMNNIEFACYYSAVMPTKIMLSQFAFTHGSHDAVEYEQSFKGVFHMSSHVDTYAKQVLQSETGTEGGYGFYEMGQFDPQSHWSSGIGTSSVGDDGDNTDTFWSQTTSAYSHDGFDHSQGQNWGSSNS